MTEREAVYYELLALRCRRGRRDAFEELVRMWERPLLYYIRRLVGDEQDSWQVLQDTWLGVLRNIGGLRDPRNMPAWLYRIARNTSLSHLRSRYADRALTNSDENLRCIEDCDSTCAFDDAEQVHYALDQVSVRQREVLTLFFLDDLTLEQIAGVLGVGVGTVKSRLHYAKKALKAAIEREGRKNE